MEFEEFRGILTKNLDEANVIITGVPFDKNASIGHGAKEAPDHIRELSKMIPPTSMNGYILDKTKLFDNGNITSENFETIQNEAFKLYSTGKFNVVLGGDHSISIALERAFFDYATSIGKIPTLIHIDAHPDICEIYEGNKYSHACPNRRSLEYGYEDKNLTILGVRGFEVQETKFFMEHPEIDVFKTTDIKALGTARLLNYLKAKYNNDHLVYLSYDIDANDPSFAPGTGTPEPFGLSNFEVIDIITGLFKNLNIGAFDIVEVSPKLDCNDITSYLAIKSLYEVLYTISHKE